MRSWRVLAAAALWIPMLAASALAEGSAISGGSAGAPPAPPGSSRLSISLSLSRTPTTTLVEPSVLIFDAYSDATLDGADVPATGSADTEVDMECSWNFGDPGQGNWTTGTTLGDRNLYYGAPISAHMYRAAGTYTVTADCSLDGETASDSMNVTIVANATAYPDADLTCISSSGTFDGLCATAGTKLTQSTVATANIVSNKRTCLRGGETFTAGSALVAPTTGVGADPPWIGGCAGFGTGKPTISRGGSQVFTVTGAVGLHVVDVILLGDAGAGDTAFSSAETNDLEDLTIVGVNTVDIHKPMLAHAGNWAGELHQGVYIVDADLTGPAAVTGSGIAGPCTFITAENIVILGSKLGVCGQNGQGEFTFRSAHAERSVMAHSDYARSLDLKTVVTLRRCNHALGCGGTGVDSFAGTNDSDHWVFGYNRLDGAAMDGAIFHTGPQDPGHYEHASTAWIEGNLAYRSVRPTGFAAARIWYKLEHIDTVAVRGNIADFRNLSTGTDAYAFAEQNSTSVGNPASANIRLDHNAAYMPEDCPTGQNCYLLEGVAGSRFSRAVGNAFYCNPTPGSCTMFEVTPTTVADNFSRLTTDADGQLFESASPATSDPFPDYRIQVGDPARNTVSPLESVLEPDGTERVNPSDPGPMDRDT